MKITISRTKNVAPNASLTIEPPVEGGVLVPFLSAEEQAEYEAKLGLEKGSLNFYAPKAKNFWFTDKPKFKLVGQTTYLNTDDPLQSLRYKVLVASNLLATESDGEDLESTTKPLVQGDVQSGTANVQQSAVRLQLIMTTFGALKTTSLKRGFVHAYTTINKNLIPESKTQGTLLEVLTNWFIPNGTLHIARINRTYSLINKVSEATVTATCLIAVAIEEGKIDKLEHTGVGAKKPYLFNNKKFTYSDLLKYITKGLEENLAPTNELINELNDNG